jgi:hypothetical protein
MILAPAQRMDVSDFSSSRFAQRMDRFDFSFGMAVSPKQRECAYSLGCQSVYHGSIRGDHPFPSVGERMVAGRWQGVRGHRFAGRGVEEMNRVVAAMLVGI